MIKRYDISNGIKARNAASSGAGVLVAVCLSAFCVPAMAHSIPDVPSPKPPTVEMGNEMSVRVQGHIRSRCALGNGGVVDMGDLTRAATAEVHIGLTCNVPFVLKIDAVNGAMNHTEMPGGQGGYEGRVQYGVGIVVPLLDPTPGQMSGQYAGHELRRGVSLDSRNAIARGGATIKFSTFGSENSLLAGVYSETINMTVQPKM